MDVLCSVCGDPVRTRQQRLTCCLCQSTYHRICTSLKQDEYRTMCRDHMLDSWLCSDCSSEDHTVNTPAEVLNEKTTTLDNACVADRQCQNTLPDLLSTVPASGSLQNVCTSSGVQNVLSASTDVQSVVSAWTGVPSVQSASSRTQDTVSTSTGVQSIASASTGVHSAASASTGVHSVVSVSTGTQNVRSTSTGVQSVASTSTGVHSIVSTSTGVHSAASASTGVHSVVSVSTGTQNVRSTSTGVHSVVSTSTGMPTSTGVQSVVSASTGVHTTTVESFQGQNSLYSRVNSLLNKVHNILAKPTSSIQRIVQNQEQRLGTEGNSLQTESEQVPNGASIKQTDVQTSADKEVGVDKDVAVEQYSCCDLHGKVKEKASEKTGKDIVQLVQTPFCKKIEDIVPPRIIVGYKYDGFDFRLSRSQIDMIKKSHNGSKYDVQVRIRFCRFNVNSVQDDMLPHGTLRINSRCINLNSYLKYGFMKLGMWILARMEMMPFLLAHLSHSDKTCIDVESKKKQKQEPIDITLSCNLHSELSRNFVNIKLNTKETFYMTCELVRKSTIDELVDMLNLCHPQHTEELVMEKFKQDDECEISTTNLKASLTCPIGKMRLIKPCRSKHCTHIQCIDARTVLSMNQNKPTWKCQICGKPAELDDLYIDGLFLKILASVPWDVVEVEFQKDGAWTHKKSASQKSVDTDMDKENTCLLLDETIDKLDVIDLTETDEECSPVKRTPLKTNKLLVNRLVNAKNVLLDKVTHQNQRTGSHGSRLGSEGSTCSESSFRTASSSSTSSINAGHSTSNVPVSRARSPVLNSAYRGDNSSYGCHRNNRQHYHHSRPYESSNRNNTKNYGYRNNYSSGNYRQTTLNQYSWRNANSNMGNSYSSGSSGYSSSNYYQSSHSAGYFRQPLWQ